MNDHSIRGGSSGKPLPPRELERDALLLLDTMYEDIKYLKEDANLLEEVILQLESERRKRRLASDPTQ